MFGSEENLLGLFRSPEGTPAKSPLDTKDAKTPGSISRPASSVSSLDHQLTVKFIPPAQSTANSDSRNPSGGPANAANHQHRPSVFQLLHDPNNSD